MQHNANCTTFYTQDHIDYLNEQGILSWGAVARKFKLSLEGAKRILATIVEDYENVHFITPNGLIYIEGVVIPEGLLPKSSKKRIRKQRPRKRRLWKDVTKP